MTPKSKKTTRKSRQQRSRKLTRRERKQDQLSFEKLEDRRLLATLAADTFETGNFSGGSDQWAVGAWTVSGDASIRTNQDSPHSGSSHVRLRSGTGDLQRTVDVTDQTDIKLEFWSKLKSFENSDKAYVTVSGDGVNWTTINTFVNGQDDNQYHQYSFDVPDVGDTLHVRFDAGMSWTSDYWYIDDVQIEGTLSAPVDYNGAVFEGNFYHLSSAVTDWTTTENEAISLGGHLVAINNAEEQAFLEEAFLVGANEIAPMWIGLTDQLTEGEFLWTTGESFDYVNWLGGEPNDNGTGEDFGTMNWGSTKGRWNDTPNAGTQSGAEATNNGPYIGIIEREAIGLAIDNVEVVEGANGTTTELVFTVTRYGDLSNPATVEWSTFDDTAIAGIDFVADSGVLDFAIGDAEGTITITVSGDADVENHEQFVVSLSNSVGTDILVPKGTGVILNDETEISIGDAIVNEGATELQLIDQFVPDGSGGLDISRIAILGTDGNGDGVDDLYVSSRDTNQILRYDGLTGVFIDAFVSDEAELTKPLDLRFGPDGHLYVSSNGTHEILRFDGVSGDYIDTPVTGLSNPQGITFAGDGSLIIANKDANEILRFDGSSLTTLISAGSGGLDRPRRVIFGPDGNGDQVEDLYVANSGTQDILRFDSTNGEFIDVFSNIGDWVTSGPSWIEFGADGTLYATGRTFTTGFESSIVSIDASGTVFDALAMDATGWGFTFDSNNVAYVGGSSFGGFVARIGSTSLATLTVTLAAPSAYPVTVDYTAIDGTATEDADYEPTSGKLVFEPGVTTRTIIVPTIDDMTYELGVDETFQVVLSNAVGGLIADNTGVATIIDDDLNSAPSITSSENTSAVEDALYSYDVEASDPDAGDPLTYSFDGAPAGMTIDPTSGLINWTPDNSQVGSNSVTVRVQDDGGLFDTQSFNVYVTNVNDAPAITSTPVTTATAESVYSYDIVANDPDAGDTLTYSLDAAPNGMTIDSSGLVQWTPSGPQTGVQITVRVQDAAGLFDTQNYSIDVAAVNHAPTVTSSAVTTATEDAIYSYSVTASDSDLGDTLTFSFDANPSGMTIDGASGLIQWTPDNDDVGVNSVTVRVADQAGAFDTQAFDVTVANTNDAPVISSTPVTVATESQSYSYDVNAIDFDPGDTLTFSLDTYPTGMTINGSTGLIQWTPTNGQLGNNAVTVRVDDGAGGSDSQNFMITVEEDSFTPTVVFSDNFEDGSTWTGQWSQDSQNDWRRKTSKKFDGSYAAEVDGRATDATLISDPVDMSGYGSADLTFAWLIEKGFDTNEFLALDFKNDAGQWIEDIRRLDGNVDQENSWHQETVKLEDLPDNYFHSDFQFRFRSTVSSSREDAYIDVVELKATSAALRGAVVDTNSKAEALALVDLKYLAKWADQSWTTGFGSNHSNYELRIGDLPGNLLGQISGNTITIDFNGAGMGWFVDRTPWESSEFSSKKDTIGKRYDLLSVLAHELGHLHGHDHADGGVMDSVLNPGERSQSLMRDQWSGGIIENSFDDDRKNLDHWFGNWNPWNGQEKRDAAH